MEKQNAAATSPGEDSGAQDSARHTPPRRPPCVPQQWGRAWEVKGDMPRVRPESGRHGLSCVLAS